MSEQTCETCGNQDVSHANWPCRACPCAYVSQWVPMPAPPEAEPVTVEALDTMAEGLDHLSGSVFPRQAAAMLRALRPLVALAEQSPVPLADLVEEAECQRRIAPKKRWSKPIGEMDAGEINATILAIGARVGDFCPHTPDGLRGYAAAKQLWFPVRDRVKLPEEAPAQ